MFSVCIPTMNRYDQFLKHYLPHYLDNELVCEVIICDENGQDIDNIHSVYSNHPKLVLVKNDKVLGPFLNKLKCCKLAKSEWIALLDSDNFADYTYFSTTKSYIEQTLIDCSHNNIILAPSFAKPQFNYSQFSGFIYTKEKAKYNRKLYMDSTTLMNTGNYIINKWLIDNINIEHEINLIPTSSSCDVIYFNVLLFEQLDMHMHIVPNLEYTHVVHAGSTYLTTHHKYRITSQHIHNRYYNL